MEQRISLLRGIPLFSSLSAEHIRLLAGLLRESSYRRRSTIYRQGELDATLYVVVSGRLRVWILDENGKRRTLNYLRAQDYFGERALVTEERRDVSVDVEEDAVLLCLQKRDFDGLSGQYPRLRESLSLSRLERLKKVPLFEKLSPQDIQRIAALVGHAHYRQGSVICRQGEVCSALYIIESGRVAMRTGDETGRQRVVSHLGDGDCFGHCSLLTRAPTDTTAEAVEDSSLLYVNQRDFDRLLREYPSIKNTLNADKEIRRTMLTQRFPWQRDDEVLVALSHKHLYAFLKSLWLLIFPLLVLGGILAIALTSHRGGVFLYAAGALVVVSGFVLVIWLFLDWRNDYYAVTNKRVVHVEKTILFSESRDEAPLENIQDLFVLTPSPMARLVGFNDLGIQTAGARGRVVFKTLDNAAWVRDRIFEQLERIKSETRAEGREAIRRRLELQLGQVEHELSTVAAPEAVPPVTEPQEILPRGLHIRFLNYIVPRMRHEEDRVVTWRKHWFRLIEKTAGPFFLLFILLQLAAAALLNLLPPLTRFEDSFWAALLIGVAAGLFLLWYRYEDWRNDVYQLTDDRIIDIDRLPLGLREERREASLAMIQDIRYEIPGITANLLDYGNVVIETAAREAVFTFDWVHHPRRVQEEIFARMDAFREKERQRERDTKTTELLDWFATYGDLTGERGSAGETSRE